MSVFSASFVSLSSVFCQSFIGLFSFSLYPWTNKYCKYPIGHPKVITTDFGSLENYFGLIKVRVLPPTDLFFPVLPRTCGGKLTFTLCALCSDSHSSACNHNERQRSWIGSYTTFELKEALDQGYQILKIFEVGLS